MESISRFLVVSIICYNLVSLVQSGSVVLRNPSFRTEDLRSIDGYVSSGLPLFTSTNGFILHSGMGPVIVKVKDPNKVIKDGIEQPNAGYYRNLPSVIPEGYEGVASTSFQLGYPITQQQSSFQTTPTSPATSFSTQQSIYSSQQPQTSASQLSYATSNFAQQLQQPTFPSTQTTYSSQPQSYQQFQQQLPTQFQQQQPQSQQFQQQQSPSSTFARASSSQFRQIDNSLEPQKDEYGYDRSLVPTSYVGGSGFRSSAELITNPVVEQTLTFEQNQLPQDLRNPFYSNSLVAQMLAQESLPAQGERVVRNWTTNKIREGKIRDLLSGAGFV